MNAQTTAGKAGHTALPWKTGATHCNPHERSFKTAIYAISEAGEDYIAETWVSFEGSRFLTKRTADDARLNSMRNAALICRAVNSHQALVAELRMLTDWVDANVGDPAAIVMINSARSALALATKGAK